MWKDQTLEWLRGRSYDDSESPNGGTFKEVLHAEGNVVTTSAEIATILHHETSVCLVVDGDLTVDGPLFIDEQHAVHVTGTLRCQNFSIVETGFDAGLLEVAEWAEFSGAPDQCQLFMDVAHLKVPVLLTESETEMDCIARKVSAEFTLDTLEDFEDELKYFLWIISDDFEAVYAALKRGETLNDAWVLANKELVRDPERREAMGL